MDIAFNLIGELLWVVVAPQNWIVAGVVFSALARWRHRLRAARAWISATAVLVLSLSALPIGDWAMGPLEGRYPPNPDLTDIAGVIVLGGAEDAKATLRHDQVHLNRHSERLIQTVALARQLVDVPVVYTGGSGALRDLGRKTTQAQVAAQFFAEMGLDMSRVILEPDARNTSENARRSAALVDETQRWVLITSAFHMPRAVASFERAGWTDLVPYPVDFNARPTRFIWDFVRQLDFLTVALREYMGQLAYWAAGR